jgi:hypothetical protein
MSDAAFHCMKASPKKLLPLILIAIAVTSLFSVQPAQAFTMTFKQVGANVVASGTGAINLTGLTFNGTSSFSAIGINPGAAVMLVGSTGVTVDTYTGFTGPTSFGSGGATFASMSSGDNVGVNVPFGPGVISVPQGYVSNAALSDSMTFNSATFASLGLTPGAHTWRWGTNGANQFFRIVIGPNTVPDGGSTVSLLGCALLGLAALRRKLGC